MFSVGHYTELINFLNSMLLVNVQLPVFIDKILNNTNVFASMFVESM